MRKLIISSFITLSTCCLLMTGCDQETVQDETDKTQSTGLQTNDQQTDQGESLEHGTEYLALELIKESLNANDQLELINEFIVIVKRYHSLEEDLKPYPFHFVSEDGKITANTVYIQGSYSVNEDIQVDVSIIQDKTFENGGLIFYNDKESFELLENYSVFKYMKSFIIFEFKSVTNTQIDGNLYTFDFIDRFIQIYKENYATYIDTDGS